MFHLTKCKGFSDSFQDSKNLSMLLNYVKKENNSALVLTGHTVNF